jgi:hypothetical protein
MARNVGWSWSLRVVLVLAVATAVWAGAAAAALGALRERAAPGAIGAPSHAISPR